MCTLAQPLDAQSTDAAILAYLCTIILDYGETENYPPYETLVTESVRTVVSISLIVDEEVVDKYVVPEIRPDALLHIYRRLAYIPKNPQVLVNLFRSNGPSSFLAQSTQLLVLLASRKCLCVVGDIVV